MPEYPVDILFCHGEARIARDPVAHWEAHSGPELAELAERAARWLAEGRIVTGLISYDAGEHLLGLSDVASSAAPLAQLHAFAPEQCQSVKTLARAGLSASDHFSLTHTLRPTREPDHFTGMVQQALAYERAGDCYQVNLAREWQGQYSGDPLSAWIGLLADHPAPWASYFSTRNGAVFGVSPECFLSVHGRRVVTRPIKGTRPRGQTPAEDRQLAEELAASAKDRAENLMIVDLLRNDLGACAVPGSVTAPEMFAIERFSNVHHMTSTIAADLRPDITPLDALLACFPGGSITGAPKRRAMEIIKELEGTQRGYYCGSQFWLDANGLESNILIRTFQAESGAIRCHGGCGIVADSVPERERDEADYKIGRLIDSLGSVGAD